MTALWSGGAETKIWQQFIYKKKTELQTTGEDEGEESIKDQFYASEEIRFIRK